MRKEKFFVIPCVYGIKLSPDTRKGRINMVSLLYVLVENVECIITLSDRYLITYCQSHCDLL